MDLTFNTDNTITIAPPRRTKKLTGTRFSAVLGLDHWKTDFQVWCQCSKVWEPPFEDTIYTKAGKAIEPKQIAYMRKAYFMEDLVAPTDVWGPDYFRKTWGNFFDHPVLGGMWDALVPSEDWDHTASGLVGHTDAVLEFKTTKRAEDWAEDVPENYALQAALYAWLLGCDEVVMVATFLRDRDYDDPEAFEVTAENTTTFSFSVSGRYPTFEEDYVRPALDWWIEHVESGVSPAFDERADAEYLKALRTDHLNPTSDVDGLMAEYERLSEEVAVADAVVAEKRKRIDSIKKQLRQFAIESIGDGDIAEFSHGRVRCSLSRGTSTSIDGARLKRDGLYDKYAVTKPRFTFNVTIDEE